MYVEEGVRPSLHSLSTPFTSPVDTSLALSFLVLLCVQPYHCLAHAILCLVLPYPVCLTLPILPNLPYN
jgi:hypothetical protein